MEFLNEEELLPLILDCDVDTLVPLSIVNKKMNNFLSNPYNLKQLGMKHDIPTPYTAKEIKSFIFLNTNDKLEIATEKCDVDYILKRIDMDLLSFSKSVIGELPEKIFMFRLCVTNMGLNIVCYLMKDQKGKIMKPYLMMVVISILL